MSDIAELILDFDHSPLESLPPIKNFVDLKHQVRLESVTLPGPIEALLERDNHPLPPPKDRENYGGENHMTYWMGGLRDALVYEQLARQHGVLLSPGSRVLEIGCSTGRMLRHLRDRETGAELWGADINVRNIRWMQKFLPSDLRVFNNHWLPQLPLEDNFFDLVYSVSVFTHIDHLESAWLLELRRVLRPGGLMIHSLHTDAMWHRMGREDLRSRIPLYNALVRRGHEIREGVIGPETFQRPMSEPRVVFTFNGRSMYNCNTFHSRRYLEREWGRFMKVESILPEAAGAQDVIVLRKTAGVPVRRTAPASLVEATPRQVSENDSFPFASYFADPESNLLYCGIPKTGCTAGKRWFVSLVDPEMVRSAPELPVHRHARRWSLADSDPTTRTRLLRDALLCTFVRDPLARLASAYTEKFTMVNRERLFPPAAEVADRIELLRNDGRSGVSFAEFVHFLCAAPDDALDEHWRPQFKFLEPRVPDVLAPVERMEEVLGMFSRLLARGDLSVPPSNRTRYSEHTAKDLWARSSTDLNACSIHPRPDQLLTPDLSGRLEERFAKDRALYASAVASFDRDSIELLATQRLRRLADPESVFTAART